MADTGLQTAVLPLPYLRAGRNMYIYKRKAETVSRNEQYKPTYNLKPEK